jgi:Flp pilus assembly pilin Flp
MKGVWRKLVALHRDDSGQTTIEYALVIAAVGIPAITVFGWLVTILAENYRMLTFLELLPFP